MSRPVAPPGLVSVDTIRRMAAQIDAREKLDADVEQLLLEASNEFLSDAASHSLRLAKHRGGDALSVDDVVLAVERKWRFKVPGFNQDLTQVIAKTGVKKATTKTHQVSPPSLCPHFA
ncbi:hypothetical protein BC830DRAFT_1123405 [Chytriomyces sp. MP71]|nr:hypothetical protein BC830DRAFT_1123405 [Chytriomyces sp. MP71]